MGLSSVTDRRVPQNLSVIKGSAPHHSGAMGPGDDLIITNGSMRDVPSSRYRTETPISLTRDNAGLLLVDHQVGLYTGVRDIEAFLLKQQGCSRLGSKSVSPSAP